MFGDLGSDGFTGCERSKREGVETPPVVAQLPGCLAIGSSGDEDLDDRQGTTDDGVLMQWPISLSGITMRPH